MIRAFRAILTLVIEPETHCSQEVNHGGHHIRRICYTPCPDDQEVSKEIVKCVEEILGGGGCSYHHQGLQASLGKFFGLCH